jgi:hypothetical protein
MMKSRGKDYLFPECYIGPDAEERLVMEIKLAALLEGFVLVNGSHINHEKSVSDGMVPVSDTNRSLSIRLECEHHRVRRVRQRKTARKVTSRNGDTKVVASVHKYIVESLDPYERLWVKCFRGTSPGMGKRASNLAEVMHRSMKSGPHSVSAGLKTEESAARQMDKAEWLGKRKKRGNAKSITGHQQQMHHQQRQKNDQTSNASRGT